MSARLYDGRSKPRTPTRYYVVRECDPTTCQMKDCDHTPTISDWRARRKPWTPREWTPRLDWAKRRADELVGAGVFVVARVHEGAPDGPVVYTATKPTASGPAPEPDTIEVVEDNTERGMVLPDKIDL